MNRSLRSIVATAGLAAMLGCQSSNSRNDEFLIGSLEPNIELYIQRSGRIQGTVDFIADSSQKNNLKALVDLATGNQVYDDNLIHRSPTPEPKEDESGSYIRHRAVWLNDVILPPVTYRDELFDTWRFTVDVIDYNSTEGADRIDIYARPNGTSAELRTLGGDLFRSDKFLIEMSIDLETGRCSHLELPRWYLPSSSETHFVYDSSNKNGLDHEQTIQDLNAALIDGFTLLYWTLPTLANEIPEEFSSRSQTAFNQLRAIETPLSLN